MDGTTRCEKTPSGSHDYRPDPPEPAYLDIRTATCACGDVMTVTRDGR
ncbi:hypothetical protein ABZ234_03315 [Nocardiopsis sp. NPDC006198]